jgi:hypothetical protein
MRQSSYEQNNEKRTRWEVEADAVGAELSWSYAQVQRARRPAADPQDSADAVDGFSSADGQHSEAGEALEDLAYLGDDDAPEEQEGMELPEPAVV